MSTELDEKINGSEQTEIVHPIGELGGLEMLNSLGASLEVKTEEKETELEEEKKEEKTEIIEEEKKEEPKEEEKKEKEEKEEKKEGETTALEDVKIALGLEDDDEADETVEGLINVAKKAVDKIKSEYEAKINTFEKHPQAKALVDHLEAGGSVGSFQRQQQIQDFSKLEIKEDNVELQEQLYRTKLQSQGMEEDEIEETVATAKDKGVLLDRANKSKDYLVKQNEKIVADQIAVEKKALDDINEVNLKVENEAKAILKTGKIAGIAITTEEAKELEDWGFKVDAKGQTARDIAYANLTVEQTLLLDKIVKSGFKAVGVKISTGVSKSLGDLKKKTTQTVNLQTSTGSTINSILGINNPQELLGATVKE